MSRAHDIINELEEDYGLELDGNFDTLSILCDHESCRHSECFCWDDFRSAVEAQLQKQDAERIAEMRSMESLYRAEVKAGIYIPQTHGGADPREEDDEAFDGDDDRAWDEFKDECALSGIDPMAAMEASLASQGVTV
jgi:hypothetical protein